MITTFSADSNSLQLYTSVCIAAYLCVNGNLARDTIFIVQMSLLESKRQAYGEETSKAL